MLPLRPENMKHRSLPDILGFKYPPDGYTDEEKQISKIIGDLTLTEIYKKLPTSRMKALVALHYDCGYPQELIGTIFDISQERVVEELGNIRKIFLGKSFRPHKPKTKISVDQLLKVCMMLGEG